MRFYPAQIECKFFLIFLIPIALFLGCSKDSDILIDSVTGDENVIALEVKDTSVNQETTVNNTQTNFENRTATFSSTNDAYVQSGKSYNQSIVRLGEGNHTSYLMFDLSPIKEISGTIKKASLQFTINSDNGNGNIEVYKASSSNWSEDNLSENIPPAEVNIGSILKEYKVGETEIIELNVSELQPEVLTLILSHKNGNDLAFASKEHSSNIGPKLEVTYEVLKNADDINIPEIVFEEIDNDVNNSPIAVADAIPSNGGVPLEVSFSGSNSLDDNGIVSYYWDFKDGFTGASPNPTHTFSTAGVYEVELTVTDEQGLKTTEIVVVTVNESQNEAPKAVASASITSGEAPLQVTFTGSNSTDDYSISSYFWNLKNGTNSNNADFTYTFEQPGTYAVDLIVKDENGLSDLQTITIVVTEKANNAPVARTSANITLGVAPLTVEFKGDHSTDDKGVVRYSWNFKDGSSGSSPNPTHTFANKGVYVVELTVTDEEGITHSNTITIQVTEPASENSAPTAVVSSNINSGVAALGVQFYGNQSYDDKAISSYFWNFKDGSTSTNMNPFHTFNQAGTYSVELTVKDAEGASNTASLTINATAPVNIEPGFYVATNGNSFNNGTSPSSPWSLEHAFNTADAGDVVYVKAGNYGNKELLSRNSGNSANPIKYIGYKNTPGDISSNQGSTFIYGESVNSSNMPLLESSNGLGKAITLHDRFITIENFQITGYSLGIETIDIATNIVLRNIILTKLGNQSDSNSYTGIGMTIKGNNTLIENCFVLDAGAEAIRLSDSDYSRINHCKVYATNVSNPTDYYFFLTGGTNNSIVENSYAERKSNLSHGGHGFVMKDLAEQNVFRNCTSKNTNIELNFSGVKYNTIENCNLYGTGTTARDWQTRLVVFNGANNNTMRNIYIQDTQHAIVWADYNDGYIGPGGDRDLVSLGYDNTYSNITVNNTETILNVGGAENFSATASRNSFTNCNFSNFDAVARTYNKTENIVFNSCSFNNGDNFVYEANGANAPFSKFNAVFQNCTWTNVGFTPPN